MPDIESPKASHHCVLIVDDQEDVRESLRDVVEMVGCSALMAENGKQALCLLANHRPCLVVMDLLMPVMSGAELLEIMRHDPSLATLPVIMSTSAPDQAPKDVALLPKPIDIHILCAWMRRMCHCKES